LFNELQEARAKLQAQAEALRDGDPADPAAEGDEKRAAANVDAGKPAPAAAVGKARSTPLLLSPPFFLNLIHYFPHVGAPSAGVAEQQEGEEENFVPVPQARSTPAPLTWAWRNATQREWSELLHRRGCLIDGPRQQAQCCDPTIWTNVTTPLRHQGFGFISCALSLLIYTLSFFLGFFFFFVLPVFSFSLIFFLFIFLLLLLLLACFLVLFFFIFFFVAFVHCAVFESSHRFATHLLEQYLAGGMLSFLGDSLSLQQFSQLGNRIRASKTYVPSDLITSLFRPAEEEQVGGAPLLITCMVVLGPSMARYRLVVPALVPANPRAVSSFSCIRFAPDNRTILAFSAQVYRMDK
jgi:hypothetical protein